MQTTNDSPDRSKIVERIRWRATPRSACVVLALFPLSELINKALPITQATASEGRVRHELLAKVDEAICHIGWAAIMAALLTHMLRKRRDDEHNVATLRRRVASA